MKIAPLWHALKNESWCQPVIIHTGQHYDTQMSAKFFHDLQLPEPDHNLGVGSGSHARQTADVMVAYEHVCLKERPEWVVVVGDVNSTLAATLVAKKLCLRVAHLEAGLRSGDRKMPEEINRLMTDAVADLLWTPSPDADDNLRHEGVSETRIERVGNIMIDAFEMLREVIESTNTSVFCSKPAGTYAVVTIHRPANVDSPETLASVMEALLEVQAELPLIFPVHPRTKLALERSGMEQRLLDSGITLLAPLSYIEFMALVRGARLVITDSGGLQEETSYLGIPCFTLRDNTERPITVTEGTNRLVRPEALGHAVHNAPNIAPRPIDLWDGHTATRVVGSLRRHSTPGA